MGQRGFSGDNGPATSAELYLPADVAVDSAGNLYFADFVNNRIRKVSNGVITTIAGGGATFGDNGPGTSAQLSLPLGVAVDSAGNVYIADSENNRIRLLTPSGPSCTSSVSPTNLQAPASGGNLTVAIQTTASCAWAIQNLPQWITYSGNVVGTGAATLTLAVTANSGVARTTSHFHCGHPDRSYAARRLSPRPSLNAVTNGATNLPGAIAPGEIVVLYGSGFGSGTTVSFNGLSAPIIYTSVTQVAAIVPYEISGTTAQVTLTYQGQTSARIGVNVASSASGVFTLDSSGMGQAAAVNQDGSINSAAHPAPPGSIISLYATGEGQTSPAGVDGKPAQAPLPQPTAAGYCNDRVARP